MVLIKIYSHIFLQIHTSRNRIIIRHVICTQGKTLITSHYAKAYKLHVHSGKRFNRAWQDLSVPRSFSPHHVCVYKRQIRSDARYRLCYRQQNIPRRNTGETASRPRSCADRSGRSRTRERIRARKIHRGSAGNRGRDRTSRFRRALPRLNANAYPPWYHSLHTSHCIINCWGSYERPQKQYVADGSISLTITSIGRNSCDRVLSTTVAEVA